MHRWWYSDENNEKGDKAHSDKSRKSLNNRSSSPKQWRFTVLFNQSLNPYETIALVGNCDELGNWDNDHAVILKKEEGSFNDEIKHKFAQKLIYSARHRNCALLFLLSVESKKTVPRVSFSFINQLLSRSCINSRFLLICKIPVCLEYLRKILVIRHDHTPANDLSSIS